MTTQRTFRFLDPGPLVDRELHLRLAERMGPVAERGLVPTYVFQMVRRGTDERLGRLSLRIGHTEYLQRYCGHIGYGVTRKHRGHRYAARSCRLVLPLAAAHGLDPLWITCNPENIASRRTCEILGAEMVEIVDLPPDTDLYARGDRQKCRYRLDLCAFGYEVG